jgi:hypothetical protein
MMSIQAISAELKIILEKEAFLVSLLKIHNWQIMSIKAVLPGPKYLTGKRAYFRLIEEYMYCQMLLKMA